MTHSASAQRVFLSTGIRQALERERSVIYRVFMNDEDFVVVYADSPEEAMLKLRDAGLEPVKAEPFDAHPRRAKGAAPARQLSIFYLYDTPIMFQHTKLSSLYLGIDVLVDNEIGRPPALGSNEQIFGVEEQILGRDRATKGRRPTRGG